MKKYKAVLQEHVDLQETIRWCEEAFGRPSIFPYQDRTNWWDQRARDRSTNRNRWSYRVDWKVDWEDPAITIGSNNLLYYPMAFNKTMIITRRTFFFLSRDDYVSFMMSWDCA